MEYTMWLIVPSIVLLILVGLFIQSSCFRIIYSSNKKKSIYYEVLFMSTVFVSMVEDLMKWRNKLTTLQDRRGKVAIVTGGARGIGLHVTKGLLKYGVDVTIGVRQVEKCEKIIEELKKDFPNGKITVLKLDLASLKSVREFAKEVSSKHDKIHLLINNAGILFGEYKVTEDGFEDKLATNYLGHFLLTHLLLENLKRGGSGEKYFSRIVNVSSGGHYGAEIFFDDINMEKYYYPAPAYTQSKMAQLLSSHHLNSIMINDRLPVRSYCVHPGVVASGMLVDFSGNEKLPMDFFVKKPNEGAVGVLYASLSPDLEGKFVNKIYSNCREGFSSTYSQNKDHQKRLFDMTLDMLKINNFGIAE